MMKKVLLTLLLAMVSLPAVFAQGTLGFELKIDSISSCNAYTWPRNNQQYSRDTVVTYVNGDTTYVLYFDKKDSYIDTTEAIPLFGECSVTLNGTTWTTAGSFLDTLTAVSTCDSIVKVQVTLANVDTVKTVTVCGSYTAPWNQVFTESRVIDTVITNSECTYHNVITLTVHPEYVNLDTIEVTAGCSYKWNNMTLTDTSVYTRGFKTAVGQCDSIVHIRVTSFSGEQSDTVAVVACDAYKPTWRDTIFTSNVYVHDSTYGTYLSTSGPAPCLHHDAIDVTIVTSVTDSADAEVIPINAGCSYTWNGTVITDTNVHYHLYTSTIGNCDSMVAIQVSFSGNHYDTTFAAYCGDAYNWKTSCPSLPLPGAATNYRFTRDTVTTVVVNDTVNGCTSYYTLSLTFYSKSDTVNQYYCGTSYNYSFKRYNTTSNMWQNASTTFTTGGYHSVSAEGDTLFSVASGTNCKTYRTLNLNLNIPEQRYRADSIDTAVCERFQFKADRKYGRWINLSAPTNNTNEVTIDSNFRWEEHHSSNQARCYDSIVHVNLVIHRNSMIERTATVCDSYTWEEFDGRTYTESGSYRDTLEETTVHGCLQIGRLTLTVNKTPVINIEGEWMLEPGDSTVLRAVPTATSDAISKYTWYVDGTQTQSGATADSLVLNNVTHNTEVHLESKSVKNCTAHNWITVTSNVGIDEVETLHVNIYPNPASRYLNIESIEGMAEVVIYNALGQQVVRRHVDGNAVQLDLGNLTSGTYTLQIGGADGSLTTRKIIVNK
ncbi:MAG: T9SS type A sorting domain-containing protein [Bacteroidales bacterium]|nr:T9SS type A sorting domain-containing protein [Bacteroidales bacterium]